MKNNRSWDCPLLSAKVLALFALSRKVTQGVWKLFFHTSLAARQAGKMSYSLKIIQMRLQRVQQFVVAVQWPNRLGIGFDCKVGSLGLAFSWLMPCSHEVGKRDHMANSDWREDLCGDTRLLCHSSGELGSALWFRYELDLGQTVLTSSLSFTTSKCVWNFKWKVFSVVFSVVVICISVPRCSTTSRPHHAGC